MKTINVVNGPQNVSAIVQGCMRMAPLSIDEAAKVIRNAYELGVTFFDHATCYTNGECEQRFGDAFPQTGLKREDVFLQGKVVDMFYFPLFDFYWPEWIPVIGGNYFEFFSAIFNVADAAITIGVIWLIIELAFLAPKAQKAAVEEKKSESEVVEN